MSEVGYACVWTGAGGPGGSGRDLLTQLAQEFSPRYEVEGDRAITIDISGLGRLLGSFQAIGAEIAREASQRGLDAHVAVAGTCTAARILARTRPGLTVVLPGEEAVALASLPLQALSTYESGPSANERASAPAAVSSRGGWGASGKSACGHAEPGGEGIGVSSRGGWGPSASGKLLTIAHWGLKTLGELAALPAADVMARLGRQGPVWQTLARGEDVRPLVPDRSEERFEATLELEWPIEGLEPLSFVLTRLLEPLSTRLERRDRAAAVLHVALGLVAGVGAAGADDQGEVLTHVRRLQFPTPLREVRTLRTLALIDMESHPPGGPIERVTVTIEPTPGRVLQHTLFSRAEPTPDEISTLLARLAALLGANRIGAPLAVDSYRPGTFGMAPFGPDRSQLFSTGAGAPPPARTGADAFASRLGMAAGATPSLNPQSLNPQSVLRRFRQPVPVRVTVEAERPIRVVADRRGFGDGRVVSSAGPWRSSGDWWATGAGGAGRSGESGGAPAPVKDASACGPREESESSSAAARASGGGAPAPVKEWSHEEWDVAMADGAVYRVFRECGTGGWFLEAIVD